MSRTAGSTTESGSGEGVRWWSWGPAAFTEAAAAGRPILLNLTAYWCHWCRLMDSTTWADPGLIRLIEAELIPLRVDADRYPHVQDRYIAAGWPTTAFLAPTGEVLWSGTYLEPAQFRLVAENVLGAWRDRRAELELEIERRQRAVEAARRQARGGGLVRREAADDVLAAAVNAFDARNGGFGEAPKFPLPGLLELLYVHGRADAAYAAMADQTLDGMLAGELWDAVEGGFYRYATAADWTAPRYEKLLEVNAGLLEAYAFGARVRGREDWRDVAERTVGWVDAVLARDGLWSASQQADPDYFGMPAAARGLRRSPPVDPTLYTAPNARWVTALAGAGARLQQDEWIVRAETALRTLLTTMAAPEGGIFHYRTEGEAPQFDFLLSDTFECARAALTVAQATGAGSWLEQARVLAHRIETQFWHDEGGFVDRLRTDHDLGMLRYRDRSFELTAAVARFFLDLSLVGGERNWRALAETALAAVGPVAGRYGPTGAVFALATEEYFERPPAVFVAVPWGADREQQGAAAALRRAAFALPVPALRVWTVTGGHAVGPQRFPADSGPVAFVWTRRGCAAPVATAEAVHTACASVL